jgi:uncharacterized membrane protein YdjX (TVP38/TMEM64 family)
MDAANKRIWLLVFAVVLVPILPWIVLGPRLEPWATGLMTGGGVSAVSREVLAMAGVALLAGDSFLPVPSTLVMSALGLALGVVFGGLAASVGVFLSGTIAYMVCRRWGVGMARRIAGEKGMARVEAAMSRQGLWLIAATRSVPVVQEATACLAGVTRMPARLFFSALAAGSVPTGFAYAAIGASALHNRWCAVALSLLVPVITWPLVHLAVRGSSRPE